jgi:hypothetical protein
MVLIDRNRPLERGVGPSSAPERDDVDARALAGRHVEWRVTHQDDSFAGAPASRDHRGDDLRQRLVAWFTVGRHNIIQQIRHAGRPNEIGC